MATLAAGSSHSFTMDPHAKLTLVVNGKATLSFVSDAPNLMSDFTVSQAQSKTYGPYGAIGTMTITAVDKSLDYTVTPGVPVLSSDGQSIVSSDGTRFLTTPLYDLPAPSSMSGVTETILAQFVVSAGSLRVLDRLEMRFSLSKSSTSETATIRVRVGTAGTTSDTQVYSSGSLLSTTNISAGTLLDFKRSAETALQKLGAGLSTGAYSGPSTIAYPAAVTVGDMDDADYYVSLTAQSSSTVETTTLQDLIARITAAV